MSDLGVAAAIEAAETSARESSPAWVHPRHRDLEEAAQAEVIEQESATPVRPASLRPVPADASTPRPNPVGGGKPEDPPSRFDARMITAIADRIAAGNQPSQWLDGDVVTAL